MSGLFALHAASCDPIATFADGLSPTREIFVSPQGDDADGNGTRAQPFRSVARAARGVRPGEAIRLLPGVHASGVYLEGLRGEAGAPIWLGGVAELEKPVIEGGNHAMHLSRVRYLIVEHLKISGAERNGINCDDGARYADTEATRHVVFRDLVFEDIGRGGNQDALKLSGVNDFFVLDSAFARTSAGGSGIDHVGCHRGLIARCTFTDMGSNGIQCKGGSADIEIRGNRFVNGGQRAINVGGSTGIQYFRPPLSKETPNAEARDIRVLANLFQGGDATVCFVGSVECVAVNNTMVRPERWILRILQETTSRDGYEFLACGRNRFANNVVYFAAGEIRTPVNVGGNTDPASFEFTHNLWYAFDHPDRSRPRLPSEETHGMAGRDPMFAGAARGDYSVLPNSPAIGRGQPWPELRADLRERCYGDPPTLGAFAGPE